MAALAWLGQRFLASEQEAFDHRVQSLIDAQLVAVDETLAAYFSGRRTAFLAEAKALSTETEALRDYIRGAPSVRQVFVMDRKGERTHPPKNAPLNEAEQRFLERSAEIWRNRDILYQGGVDPTQAARSTVPPTGEPPQRLDGWYVWHWGTETNVIYWRRTAEDAVIGFEMEPARVKADLIGLLPSTTSEYQGGDQARVQLIDERGATIYQWGEYDNEAGRPLALRPLSHPLSSWKLAYRAPALSANTASRQLLLASVIASFAVALGGLALYLYREHTRAARLATQRMNFVNQVSHELKTPLTNIRLYAELLADQIDETEGKPRRYVDIIVAESERLSRLILNVLNFGRLQREPLRLRREPGCVDTVVRTALEAFGPALQAKNVVVELRAAARATVSLDADALEQILNNLFSNVEKYAAAGGKLEVTTSQDAHLSRVRVHDHGPGIPRRESKRIFEPFYRISSKLSDGISGTGIGLTIARGLARLHGGDLTLIDTDDGACFEVSLRTAGEDA